MLLRLAARGQFRLSALTSGSGRVQAAEVTAGLDCGTSCSALFDPTAIGSAHSTCANWSNAAGAGHAGGYGYDNHDAWYYESRACSVVGHLYCVEP